MLIATGAALLAATLHASWNLLAKRSADPFLALWGQFLLAGALSGVVVAATGGLPRGAWLFALGSGLFHIPYVVALAWAYGHGDFSLAYPIARGGGALLGAIGGIVLLGDEIHPVAAAGIGIVIAGMVVLGIGAAPGQVGAALVVAASIGGYTLLDSHASREYGRFTYVFATHAMTGLATTVAGVALGRREALIRLPRAAWLRMAGGGALSLIAYGLVLVAVRRAPVGYVAALRETSVLIAVFAGSKYLAEGTTKRRTIAAVMILLGLVTLVAGH